MNIMIKELRSSNCYQLQCKRSVLFQCDNGNVVAALSNRTAKDNAVMHLRIPRVVTFYCPLWYWVISKAHSYLGCLIVQQITFPDILCNIFSLNPQVLYNVNTNTHIVANSFDYPETRLDLLQLTIKEVLLPLFISCTSVDSNGIYKGYALTAFN